jgi:hypothetical protein
MSSQMAVKLSALHINHSIPPGRILVLISVRGQINPRAIMQLERLAELKNPLISSGTVTATCIDIEV